MTPYGLQLVEMGYRPGARNPEVERLDADIVAGMRCSNRVNGKRCGGQMRYEPYHTPISYVALAVCLECGEEREF